MFKFQIRFTNIFYYLNSFKSSSRNRLCSINPKFFTTSDTTINNTSNKKAKEKDKTLLFNECDLRVGRIMELNNMENSEDIYCLKVDVGEESLREIGAGLRKYLPPEELKESNVIVFCNLKPRKLGQFLSNGMLLCGANESRTQFELLRPNTNARPGERVYLEEGDIQSPDLIIGNLNDKKFKKIIALLNTDENCSAKFNNVLLITESGLLSVKSLKNCQLS